MARPATFVRQVICLVLMTASVGYAPARTRAGSPAEARVEARLTSQAPGRDTRRVWTLEHSSWRGESRVLRWRAADASVSLHYTLHESRAAAKAWALSDVKAISGGRVVPLSGVGDEAFLTSSNNILFRRGRLTATVRTSDNALVHQVAGWLLAELDRESLGSADEKDPDQPDFSSRP